MQENTYNEIVRFWMEQVIENRGKDAELTLKFCNDIIDYGIQNGDNGLIGYGYFYRGETYYCLNDGNHFFEEISKALSYLEKAQEWELVAKCYNFLGIWAVNRGNAPIALDYYLNGIGYCRKHHLKKMEALMNINVGSMNIECNRLTEAQAYLEAAYSYMEHAQSEPDYHAYMVVIHLNMAKCLIRQDKLEDAGEQLQRIYKEHWDFLEEIDRLDVYNMEALYYHKLGNEKKRDHYIAMVQENVNGNMPLLDVADDMLDYTRLLLEIDKQEEFWKMVETLEPMVRNCAIINMQLRLISLKLRFYRKHGQSAEYLQAAGLYYELSEIKEKEMQDMMGNVMNLRRSLESANRARKEMEVQNRILLEKSEMDPLTRMANRFRLRDFSEEAFERATRYNGTLLFEILDIDYFKEFNDNYGHQAGDGCLTMVADAIKSIAQKHNGFCARYGGDEFVLIYEDVTREQAFSYAAELKEKVVEQNLTHEFSKAVPYVTISQGLCWGIPKEGQQAWDYLHAADNMLYKVKARSRNSFCLGNIGDPDDCWMEDLHILNKS